MPRYKLRTLLILVAVLPPLFAGAWLAWSKVYDVLFVRQGIRGLVQDNGDGTYTTSTLQNDGTVLIETRQYRTKKQ